jgi:hypothetical protein
MHGDSHRADDRKGQEAHRNPPAHQLVEQQHEIVPRGHGVQLALSGVPHSEPIGQLRETQRPVVRCEQIGQDLETDRRQSAYTAVQHRAAHHEESAHRIRQIAGNHQPAEPHRETAHARAPRVPIADVAARRVAAAHHDVGIAPLQGVEHLRQEPLVMLHVGIHHREVVRRGREHALDAGGREAAAPDPPKTADAAVGLRVLAHQIGRAVGRIVIDEDDLPRTAAEAVCQAPDQLRDIASFIERRHDDRQFRAGTQRRRHPRRNRIVQIMLQRSMVFDSAHFVVGLPWNPDSPSGSRISLLL